MTLPNQNTSATFIGTGLVSVFPLAFKVTNKEDVIVTIVDAVTAAETTLILDTDYTVSQLNDDAGAVVTYLAGPLLVGNTLIVERNVAYTQTTDINNQSGFYPEVIETALDYLTMQTQQLQLALSRALMVSRGTATPLPLQGTLASRAGRVLGFTDSGDQLLAGPTMNEVATASTSASTALLAADRAEAAAILAETLLPSVRPVRPLEKIISDGTLISILIPIPLTGSDQLLVYIGGALQPARDEHYTIATGALDTTLTFSEPVPEGLEVYYVAFRRFEMPAMAPEIIDFPDSSTALDLWGRNRPAPTRAFFVANQAGVAWQEGDVVFAGGIPYERVTGAMAIADLPGWVPWGDIYADHFGAVACATEDDTVSAASATTAIQAAFDYKLAEGIEGVVLCRGWYRIDGEIHIKQRASGFDGWGGLVAYHETGGCVRFYRQRAIYNNIVLTSGGTRNATLRVGSYGLRFESENLEEDDQTLLRMQEMTWLSGEVIRQPWHGVVVQGSAFTGTVINQNVSINRGAGWVIDQGFTMGGRFVVSTPGLVTMIGGKIGRNGGEALRGGDKGVGDFEDGGIVRVKILNMEIIENAKNASVRKVPAHFYYSGSNLSIETSVLTSEEDKAAAISGAYFLGRDCRMIGNRYIGLKHIAIFSRAALQTSGCVVDGGSVLNSADGASMALAIKIQSDNIGSSYPKDVQVENLVGSVTDFVDKAFVLANGVSARVVNGIDRWESGIQSKGVYRFGFPETVTISSGAAAPVNILTRLDTEGGASYDYLDNLTLADGQIVYLRNVSPSRKIIIRHGFGNIYCNNRDVVLGDVDDVAVFLGRIGNAQLVSYQSNTTTPNPVRSGLITVADDEAGTLSLIPASKTYVYGILEIVGNTSSSKNGRVAFRAGTSEYSEKIDGTLTIETGVLTGTDGVDGDLSISVSGGLIYIENRTGTSRTYSYTLSSYNDGGAT